MKAAMAKALETTCESPMSRPGEEPALELGRLGDRAPAGQDVRLAGGQADPLVRLGQVLVAGQEPVGEPHGLVPAAQVEQALDHRHRQPVGHLGDAPLLAQLQAGVHRPHAGGRSLQLEQLGAEVAVGQGGAPAEAEPQAQLDRLPHVLEAAEVADLVADTAPVLQGSLPDVVGTGPLGQVHGPLEPVERLRRPPRRPDLLAHLEVGVGEPWAGRLPFQHGDGRDDQAAGAGGLAPVPEHPGLAGHRLAGAEVVAAGLEAGDGLGQQPLGLHGPSGLLGGLGRLLQDPGPSGMGGRQQPRARW
jgi:hypothetical protein